ncbi:hypothetical protein R5R35_012868 [Gryllus longicercus]|uniref:BSD domain-containing protein n=1 Tax=Gryllus longicercus TaxID=2509291 RepID=A0AAN9VWU9_9ORTH
MFSGLTNQVSSWMGGPAKKEGDPQQLGEEKLSSPVADIEPIDIGEGDKKDVSPTKAGGSKLEMLSNVKGQMSSWLSTGITGIQGLRRNEETVPDPVGLPPVGDPAPPPAAATGATAMGGGMGGLAPADGQVGVESPASEKSVKGSPVEQKEDDDSSATGGADSDVAASEPGTPGEDKEGAHALGGVSTKALQGAKSIGSFLFSAVNKAGKTVTEATTKIKKTVEENFLNNFWPIPVNSVFESLLGEFNKEQEAFIKEKQGKGTEAAVPPWVGCPNEENLKEEFLTLSTDRRNFVRSPPAGVEFHFDYDTCYPVAMATLAEDPNLEKMRFELVPKVISEETFWRNYFYRVSLIRQANELSSMAQEGAPASRTTSMEGEPTAKPEHDVLVLEQAPTDSPTHEFVSDTFHASSSDIEEVREGMKKLGMDPDKRNA